MQGLQQQLATVIPLRWLWLVSTDGLSLARECIRSRKNCTCHARPASEFLPLFIATSVGERREQNRMSPRRLREAYSIVDCVRATRVGGEGDEDQLLNCIEVKLRRDADPAPIRRTNQLMTPKSAGP